MTVTVTVIICTLPTEVKHGYFVCHPRADLKDGRSGIIRAGSCYYGCYEGYRINGPSSTLTCRSGGVWSELQPTCERVTCPPLSPPPTGTFQCTDDNYFLSACLYRCSRGYGIRPGMSSVRVCGAWGTWRGTIPQCIDTEPPQMINCQSYISVVANKNFDTAFVNWYEPIVQDNSNEDIQPKLSGPLIPGTQVSAGTYHVVYTAEDSTGNTAEACNMVVVVKVLTCSEQFPTPYLRIICTEGRRYGATCNYTCEDGWKLHGSDSSVCDREDFDTPFAEWTWTQSRPVCQAGRRCPPLTPPTNGALACDLWEYGNFCQLQCMTGTDIPPGSLYGNNGLLVCGTSGKWMLPGPLPECTGVRLSRHTYTLASINYFTGYCYENETLHQIQKNFIASLKSSFFREACQEKCEVANVQVFCGPVRNKRSANATTDEVYVSNGTHFKVDLSFEIQSQVLSSGDSVADFQVAAVRSRTVLDSLSLNLSNTILQILPSNDTQAPQQMTLSFGHSRIFCPHGTFPSYRTFACVECPKGSHYSAMENNCSRCPLGTYQPDSGKSDCVSCPIHTTTVISGAVSKDQCLSQCPPGSFSTSGVKPCSLCFIGSQQSQYGARNCSRCPGSKGTVHEGTNGIEKCQEFDLTFPDGENATSVLHHHNMSLTSSQMTVTLWFQGLTREDTEVVNIRFGDRLQLTLSLLSNETLHLWLDSALVANKTGVNSAKWHYIKLDILDRWASVYIDNQTAAENVSFAIMAPFHDVISNFTVAVTLGGNGFSGSVSQLNIWSDGDQLQTGSLRPRCFENRTGDILSWQAFLQSHSKDAFLQFQSKCDDTNECISSPCQHGSCLDKLGDYRCICDGGFMGRNCDINKDDCQGHVCANGSTCVDAVQSYSCACPPNFTGQYCDDIFLDGSWGTWGNWTSCSVTCGEGARLRVRICDDPAPQNGGLDCEGNSTEIGICNDTACPVCDEIFAPEHGRMDCNEDADMINCDVTCELGYDFDIEPLPKYFCGNETGHEWNFQTDDNPNKRLPNCQEIKPADNLTSTYQVNYQRLVCSNSQMVSEVQGKVLQLIQELANNLECVESKRCQVDKVAVTNCGGQSRNKREASPAGISITVSNKPTIVGVQTSIEDVVKAIQQLNTSGQAGSFTVTIGGTDHYLDLQSGQATGNVTCLSGWTKVNYYCIPCGPGTFYINGYCDKCDLGRYQNNTGKNFCYPCPLGKTTPGKGSINASECSVPTKIEDKSIGGWTVLMIVGTSFGLLTSAILIIAIVLFCRYWKRKRQVHVLEIELKKMPDKMITCDCKKMTYLPSVE